MSDKDSLSTIEWKALDIIEGSKIKFTTEERERMEKIGEGRIHVLDKLKRKEFIAIRDNKIVSLYKRKGRDRKL